MSKKIRKQRRVRYTNAKGITRLVTQKQRAYYKGVKVATKKRVALKKSIGKAATGKSFKKLGVVVTNKSLQRGTFSLKGKKGKSVKFSAAAFGVKNSTIREVFDNFDRNLVSGDDPTYSSKVFRKSIVDSYDTNFERELSQRSSFFDCLKPTAKRKFLDSARLDLAKVQSNRYLFILNGQIIYEDDASLEELDEIDENLNKDASQNLGSQELKTFLTKHALRNIEKYATKQDFKTTGECGDVGAFKSKYDKAKRDLDVEDVVGSKPEQIRFLLDSNIVESLKKDIALPARFDYQLATPYSQLLSKSGRVPAILKNANDPQKRYFVNFNARYWRGEAKYIAKYQREDYLKLINNTVRTNDKLNWSVKTATDPNTGNKYSKRVELSTRTIVTVKLRLENQLSQLSGFFQVKFERRGK